MGKTLTVAAAIDAFIRLHRDLPAESNGFALAAECAADGRGFVVDLAWLSGPRPTPTRHWSYHMHITRGAQSLYGASGGEDLSSVKQVSNYADQRATLENALKTPPNQSVVLYYNSRLSAD